MKMKIIKGVKITKRLAVITALGIILMIYWVYMRTCVIRHVPGNRVTKENSCLRADGR